MTVRPWCLALAATMALGCGEETEDFGIQVNPPPAPAATRVSPDPSDAAQARPSTERSSRRDTCTSTLEPSGCHCGHA